MMTMLKIASFDGWSDIARDIAVKQGFLYILPLLIYMFLISYVFLNLLIGIVVEFITNVIF